MNLDGRTATTAPVVLAKKVAGQYLWTCPFCTSARTSHGIGHKASGCSCGKRVLLECNDLTWREQHGLRVFRLTGGRCWYCGGFLFARWTIDHVEPRIKGGTNRRANLVPACHACNGTKSHMSREEWRAVCALRWRRAHRIAGLPEPAGPFRFWGEENAPQRATEPTPAAPASVSVPTRLVTHPPPGIYAELYVAKDTARFERDTTRRLWADVERLRQRAIARTFALIDRMRRRTVSA